MADGERSRPSQMPSLQYSHCLPEPCSAGRFFISKSAFNSLSCDVSSLMAPTPLIFSSSVLRPISLTPDAAPLVNGDVGRIEPDGPSRVRDQDDLVILTDPLEADYLTVLLVAPDVYDARSAPVLDLVLRAVDALSEPLVRYGEERAIRGRPRPPRPSRLPFSAVCRARHKRSCPWSVCRLP